MRITILVAAAAVSLFSASTVRSQNTFTVPLYVSNTLGAIDTLRFGLDPAGTYGIDAGLGEFEYPPFPPASVFESRFVNIPGNPTGAPDGLGEGVKTDIRGYRNANQIDTFRIKFQPGDGGFPVTISWPPGIGATSRSMTIRSAGKTVDMTSAGSIVVDDADVSIATIIREGDPESGVGEESAGRQSLRIHTTPSVVRGGIVEVVYQSAADLPVAIEIYSIMGDLVARATPDSQWGRIALDSRMLPSGRYFVLLQSGLASARSSFVIAE